MNFKTIKENSSDMNKDTLKNIVLATILVFATAILPNTSSAQTKLKVKKGLRSHRFKIGDEILIYRNAYDEFESEETIQGFTQNEIILGNKGEILDTIPINGLYAISTPAHNVQLDDVFLIPIGASLLTLYISPFTGITKDGYKPKNVLIVGGSAIAFNGIVFGLGSIGRAKQFNLCESKVKIK